MIVDKTADRIVRIQFEDRGQVQIQPLHGLTKECLLTFTEQQSMAQYQMTLLGNTYTEWYKSDDVKIREVIEEE